MLRVKAIGIVTLLLGVLTLFKAYVLGRAVTFQSVIWDWGLMSLVGVLLAEREIRQKGSR